MHPSDPTSTIAPTREDPVARGASQWLGGPVGRRAAIGRRGIQPAVVVLSCMATVVMALSVVVRGHCVSRGWSAGDQFWHACYSDIPVVYQSSGLADGVFAYGRGVGVGQPAGTGVVMWLLSVLVPAGSDGHTLAAAQVYLGAWAVLLTILLVLLVAMLVRAAPRTRWSVAHLALSPVVVTSALVSFDLLAITLAVAGLLAWGRRRPFEAGVLLGLALTCRTPTIVLVVALGLVCLRAGRLADWSLTAGMSLLTAVAVIGTVVAFSGTEALDVYSSWAAAEAGYGSLAYALTSNGVGVPTGLLTVGSVVGWLLALAVAALFALGTARRPTVAEVALVLLVGVAVTSRSLPPQWALWVLPLLALVGVRWRDHLVWAGIEIVYFLCVWLHIAAGTAPDRGLPAGWFAVVAVVRLLGWVWLAWRVAERARAEPSDVAAHRTPEGVVPVRPEPFATSAHQGVVTGEAPVVGRPERDPIAGVAAGAPDRFILRVV